MAAVLSSTGTWTALKTDLTKIDETTITPRMETVFLNGQDLSNVPNEILQMIQLAQVGWGAQNGTNHRLGFWATCILIRDWMTSLTGAGVPKPH